MCIRDRHGETQEGMSAIHAEVKALEAGFVKRGLMATLVAKWVRVDSVGGFEALSKREERRERKLFAKEWVKVNPRQAMERIRRDSLENSNSYLMSSVGLLLAQRSPGIFLEYLDVLPFDQIGVRTTAHDGLDLIAQQRPLELKDAAMEFEGNRQRILLSAALKGWAKLDPKSSLSWVQENLTDDKQVQSERFFSVAEGWAEERPAEFLSELDMICQNPPADWTSEVLYARLGSLALVGVAEKDLEGAFSWWGRNREQIEVKQLHSVSYTHLTLPTILLV